jgi:hypothetical protein
MEKKEVYYKWDGHYDPMIYYVTKYKYNKNWKLSFFTITKEIYTTVTGRRWYDDYDVLDKTFIKRIYNNYVWLISKN